ncbi:MAG: glycosyltransferase family 4 protein [Armatimonadota bacterium]|nr:glycosyltransferase family 4 protein [Armatimonadota bacterium]
MRLLLIGVGFFPCVVAGDKNFFTRLIPLLARSCESIDVFSVNDCGGSEQVVIGSCQVSYHNVMRPLHFGNRGRFFAGSGSLLDYRHKHSPPQEIFELLLTTVAWLPWLRRLVREKNIEVVHFMDNMGFSMPLVKWALGDVMVTHSAMAYAPRGRFYDKYLRLSMGRLDKIVPYSTAYASKLRELGISAERIEVIRWGVQLREDELSKEKKAIIRKEYNVPDDARFMLWTGFIQQIQEADFFAAVDVAKRVVKIKPNCRFIFAFKPRSFRLEYKNLESEGIQIETNIEHFAELLETADFLYSPLLRRHVIVAPPLTWLEAMNMGTPVISTAAGGVDEVVINGKTGFVAPSFNNLEETLIKATDFEGLQEMSNNCRNFIAENCDIKDVAESYLQMWRKNRG